jgi:hypothetical protein
MKKVIFTLLILIFSGSANAQMPGKNCNEIYNQFYNSKKEITKEARAEMEVCRVYCEKMPALASVNKFCGVEECKVQYATQNKTTDWCCQLKNYYSYKKGVQNPPLQMLENSCKSSNLNKGTDVMQCLEYFNSGNKIPEKCCVMVDDIIKFSPTIGNQYNKICTEKRSGAVCRSQFASKGGFISDACCMHYNENKADFKNSRDFKNVQSDFIEALNYYSRSCKSNEEVEKRNPQIKQCTDFYKETGKINDECCIAYYNGALLPARYGINYLDINQHCFPEKLR